MKRIFIFAVAALALVACNKNLGPETAVQGTPSKLTVSISSNATKAETIADTENEAKVNSLQIFVFRADELDVYGTVANDTEIELAATTGDRTVYAVVNAPDLSSIAKKSVLEAEISLFTQNTATNFVMVGKKDVTLGTETDVVVPVDRIAARIKLDKVTRNFTSAALADATFEIVRFYETNVVGNQTYGLTAPSTLVWYTLPGAAIETGKPLLYDKLETAAALAQEASYETAHSLYAYPNALTADDYVYDEDGAFVSANGGITRFVMECKINDAFYTYPIEIKGIQNNKSYEIRNLVITRLGNPSDGDDDNDPGEDEPIVSEDYNFSITVNDWGLVLLGDEGTVTI